ncbi:MAG: hypothetical protein ABMA64_43400 [Myxococcota bacterium]
MTRWWILAACCGCGPRDPCVDLQLGDSGVGLALSPETHPGWGRSECFDCHVAARLHLGGCLPDGAVDPEALQGRDEPCETCHGENGEVNP